MAQDTGNPLFNKSTGAFFRAKIDARIRVSKVKKGVMEMFEISVLAKISSSVYKC